MNPSLDQKEYESIVDSLQKTTADTVKLVGGYWPPQNAAAAVAQRLGFAASSVRGIPTSKSFETSVFDIIWLTVCIANQYCVDLGQLSRTHWSKSEFDDLGQGLLAALVEFGHLSNVLNRYESGIYLQEEPADSVGPIVIRMHAALFWCLLQVERSIERLKEERIRHVRSYRGKSSIPETPRFDPSYSSSAVHFRRIANTTACPYAKAARVWGLPDWVVGETINENVKRLIPVLKRFVHVAQPEGLDGVVLEVPDCGTLPELGVFTKELLHNIGSYSKANPMALKVESRNWRFHLLDMEVFITVFSSIYPSTHQRHSPWHGSAFYFVQPRMAFKSRKLDKEATRKQFIDRGQDYTALVEKVKSEAQKFIKPLKFDEPLIKWW